MRILHVTPSYAPSVGGIETTVSELASRARRSGIEADVVHVAAGLPRRVRQDGDFSVTTLPLVGHRLLGWAPGLAAMASRYDLLHVHDPQVGALTLNIGSRWSGVPAVLSTHGGFGHTQKAAWAKRIHGQFTAPRLLRRYTRVMASSETDQAVFGRYAAHTVLVENGVDTQRYRSTPNGSRDLRRWIYWGRFAQHKRLDALLRSIAAWAQQGVHIDLAICGLDFDGILPSLKALTRSLGIAGQVHFRLGLSAAELTQEAASRGVFALASAYEGFGLSLLEAMGAGLIPVCCDVAPMNRLVGNTGHFLAFDGSERDLAAVKAFLAASTPEQLELRLAAGMQRAEQFDWSVRFEAFVRQYQDCIRSHAPIHPTPHEA